MEGHLPIRGSGPPAAGEAVIEEADGPDGGTPVPVGGGAAGSGTLWGQSGERGARGRRMEHAELVGIVDELEAAVARAGAGELSWREVWDRIRRVGDGFRGIRFPTRDEHVAQWTRFRALVDRTKELQQEWRGQAEEKVAPLLDRVEAFAASLEGPEAAWPRWKQCWEEIRAIGEEFKATPFPRREDRSAGWRRFQEVVARVKEGQERERSARRGQAPRSRLLAAALLALVEAARPLEAGGAAPAEGREPVPEPEDAGVGDDPAGGESPAPGGDDVPLPIPPAAPRTESLKECSGRLREARRLFSEHKGEMLPPDRRAVFDGLKAASAALDEAWARWKASKSGGGEGATPADGDRRAEWEARLRENVARLEDRLARLREVEERKERHMEELRGKQRGAGGGDFRARIDAWLEEEREALDSVRAKMTEIRGWLDDARGRLGAEA